MQRGVPKDFLANLINGIGSIRSECEKGRGGDKLRQNTEHRPREPKEFAISFCHQ